MFQRFDAGVCEAVPLVGGGIRDPAGPFPLPHGDGPVAAVAQDHTGKRSARRAAVERIERIGVPAGVNIVYAVVHGHPNTGQMQVLHVFAEPRPRRVVFHLTDLTPVMLPHEFVQGAKHVHGRFRGHEAFPASG